MGCLVSPGSYTDSSNRGWVKVWEQAEISDSREISMPSGTPSMNGRRLRRPLGEDDGSR